MSTKKLFLPILRDGKYGFIDKNNNIVIKPKFKYVSERFRDGYCIVTYIKRIGKSVRWVLDTWMKVDIIIYFCIWIVHRILVKDCRELRLMENTVF
ncbi:WG repeat-containing protein [Paraclostridium bifermentans]|uniref:WG repeat-containing protein n=1 Tax=Paraclostridium bifermentans TaxID=1490 RepID=A0ABY8R1J8_PARBF|nr:WG repeat-containing protein [Paraclostridium bifermentans]